jgi:hypothetical protein
MTRYQVYKACPIPGLEAFLAYYAGGEIDRALIQSTLDKKFIGKRFDPYCSADRVANQIVALLSHSKRWSYLSEGYSLYSKRESAGYATIYWNGMWLGSVTIHKKKGRWERGCWGTGGSYEWTISSIEVSGFNDIQARVDSITVGLAEKQAEDNKKLLDACSIVKAIQGLFPGLDEWAIRSKIDWLQKNQYKVFDYLKKEVQG